MTTLMKLRNMPIVRRSLWNYYMANGRGISTSKKNNDTVTATDTCEKAAEPQKQDWVSYGFDYHDKAEDTSAHHASFFFSVTLCLVMGGFYFAYSPDIHMRDWASREAFLELRRREKEGKPAIDPNYIDPSLVTLPSEEELCDVEIII